MKKYTWFIVSVFIVFLCQILHTLETKINIIKPTEDKSIPVKSMTSMHNVSFVYFKSKL